MYVFCNHHDNKYTYGDPLCMAIMSLIKILISMAVYRMYFGIKQTINSNILQKCTGELINHVGEARQLFSFNKQNGNG